MAQENKPDSPSDSPLDLSLASMTRESLSALTRGKVRALEAINDCFIPVYNSSNGVFMGYRKGCIEADSILTVLYADNGILYLTKDPTSKRIDFAVTAKDYSKLGKFE